MKKISAFLIFLLASGLTQNCKSAALVTEEHAKFISPEERADVKHFEYQKNHDVSLFACPPEHSDLLAEKRKGNEVVSINFCTQTTTFSSLPGLPELMEPFVKTECLPLRNLYGVKDKIIYVELEPAAREAIEDINRCQLLAIPVSDFGITVMTFKSIAHDALRTHEIKLSADDGIPVLGLIYKQSLKPENNMFCYSKDHGWGMIIDLRSIKELMAKGITSEVFKLIIARSIDSTHSDGNLYCIFKDSHKLIAN